MNDLGGSLEQGNEGEVDVDYGPPVRGLSFEGLECIYGAIYARRARVVEMTGKHLDDIPNLAYVSFDDYFESRIAGLEGLSPMGYGVRRAALEMGRPLLHAQFALYQIKNSLDA